MRVTHFDRGSLAFRLRDGEFIGTLWEKEELLELLLFPASFRRLAERLRVLLKRWLAELTEDEQCKCCGAFLEEEECTADCQRGQTEELLLDMERLLAGCPRVEVEK